MSTPNPGNYVLGRGALFVKMRDLVTGEYANERHLGNVTELKFAASVDMLDHFNSLSGFRSKDKTAVVQAAPMFNFTLDEFDPENIALLMYGLVEDETQQESSISLALTSVELGVYYDLEKRGIGIYKSTIGTVTGGPFTAGETIEGATSNATAKIAYVGSGVLLLTDITGTFAVSETVSGDTSSASATMAKPVFNDGLVVVKSTTGNTYYGTSDYRLDKNSGRISFSDEGALPEGSNVTVLAVAKQLDYKKIKMLKNPTQECFFRYVSDNPEGKQMELRAWRVTLQPDGDTGLITQEWATMAFKASVLKDSIGHPDSPYMDVYTF